VPTGVDRVGSAYLRALLNDPVPLFGLVRSRFGYLLFDDTGMSNLAPLLSGPVADQHPDTHRKSVWRRARREAIGRVPPAFLRRMLRSRLPRGFAYLNVGHSNLTTRVLDSLRDADAKICVMIHDVIPLEFPEFQREGTVPRFAAMLDRVAERADLVIYNSEDTKRRTEARLTQPLKSIVAHLGTEPVEARPDDLPPGLPPEAPFFVCLGTIEPRKNHAFLLDIWDEMGPDAPALIIAGSRGWNNEDVFKRLDALPANGRIREISGLSDGAIAALLSQSAGLLFPSHAEGFGLPATEAARLGTPIIANDLTAFRELLGDIPIYASVSDRYLWINKIKQLAVAGQNERPSRQFQPPSWDAHFNVVLRLT
jgi:glycosyltransferase involved in cell wall biosynthesis